MMRRILVTGGSGLIGTALQTVCKQPTAFPFASSFTNLETDNYFFTGSSECNLADLNATRVLFQRCQPTHVIHLAARVGGLYRNMSEPVEMWLDNVAISNNVMQCAHEFHVHKMIGCLSTCIFPDNVHTYPITESMLHSGPPHHANEPYAYAKRMMDVLARAYRREYNEHFVSVIPTNVYGSNDNYHYDDAHVVAALTRRMYEAKRHNIPSVTVCGSGKALRQFIYSTDVALLLLWALQTYDEVEPIILAPNVEEEISIADLAQLIARVVGYEGELTFDTTKVDGQHRKTVCNNKLRRLCPNFKFTPMEVGIQRSVEWFVEHYDTARM